MVIPGNVVLFEDITAADVIQLLSCLAVHPRSFEKGAVILREGDPIESIGIILTGFVQIVRNDYAGNRIIQAGFGSGSIFAESFVCAGVRQSPVNVVATEDSSILFVPFTKMIRSCETACSFHHQLIENMMKLLARKNLMLNAKLEIAAKRTIREKVVAYLELEQKKSGQAIFDIPFGRNELADYLCVDRSALSRELGNMKESGLIFFEGKQFALLRK